MKYSKADFRILPQSVCAPGKRQPEVPHRSIAGGTGLAKRFIDISVAAAGLIVLSPLLAATAIAIKLTDGGPTIYRQRRLGLRGSAFTILKFRTMHDSAERDLGPVWSVPRDPRCTRIGGVLRRLGLDELPQLWNILRGDMSLVGPRPERPEFDAEFRTEFPDYVRRNTVRCGLTGFAQIHGWRGDTGIEARLRHDLFYIDHWSLQFDIRILLLTLVRGWSERARNGVRIRG